MPLVPVLRAALLLALALQLARLVWMVVTPLGPIGAWQGRSALSADRAATALTGDDVFFRLDQPASSGVVTSLQLTLFGIRLDDATGRGSAIIATPDGVQKSYAVGEAILPGVTLQAVAFDHVTIDRSGSHEDLFIDQSRGGAPVNAPPAPAALSSSVATAPTAGDTGVSASDLRSAIGFIPRIDGGRVSGLVVRQQGGSDLFHRLGFRNGDVITQVNARPVSSADDLQSIAAGLGSGGNLSVSVQRGSETLPLVIAVKGQ